MESSISLTLSSAKANSLLTQVHRELEAEDRERERQAEADRRREELAERKARKLNRRMWSQLRLIRSKASLQQSSNCNWVPANLKCVRFWETPAMLRMFPGFLVR